MANKGKNTNRSQFFIILSNDPLPKLDGKHVVFGKVAEGLEILDKIEKVGEKNEKPKKPIKVEDCGEL